MWRSQLSRRAPAKGSVASVQGLVFGVGTDKGVIKLFDVRSYAQGPFDAFTVCLLLPKLPKIILTVLPNLWILLCEIIESEYFNNSACATAIMFFCCPHPCRLWL